MDPFVHHPHLYEKAVAYADLILKWSSLANLLSHKDASQGVAFIIQRHFVDSCQLSPFMPANTSIADVGSGAGFPGLVLALLGHSPVSLIERDTRKCFFLAQAIRLLDLGKTVRLINTDSLSVKETFDVITCRALGNVKGILDVCRPIMNSSSRIVLLKSQQQVQKEMKEAARTWHFEAQLHPNPHHASGCILNLTQVHRSTAHKT